MLNLLSRSAYATFIWVCSLCNDRFFSNKSISNDFFDSFAVWSSLFDWLNDGNSMDFKILLKNKRKSQKDKKKKKENKKIEIVVKEINLYLSKNY